jgi:hypothetical protein
MLTTPGGKPASLIRPASLSAVRGVISEGWQIIFLKKVDLNENDPVGIKLHLTFRTVVLPVARAGPIFHATIAYIKCISRTLDVLIQTHQREVPRCDLSLARFDEEKPRLEGLGVSQLACEKVGNSAFPTFSQYLG